MAAEVLDLARGRQVTLGCAESCTGGLIAAALTDVAGSSDVFKGGVVSYWEEVKESVLGVPADVIGTHGVVSAQVAEAMAQGARRVLGCDYAVSTTGIAGPGGAEPGKPVGTVWFAVATPEGTASMTTCRGQSRSQVRALAVQQALELLRDALQGPGE